MFGACRRACWPKTCVRGCFSKKESSESLIIKIGNEDEPIIRLFANEVGPILRLLANFENVLSVHAGCIVWFP
jgi:hypothetical protein